MRPLIAAVFALLLAALPAAASPPDEPSLYHYRAVIIDCYDADTCEASIDLGFNIAIREKLRLARIDAPELRGETREAGLAARDFLSGLVRGKPLIIRTIRDRKEKFGRYLAEIILDGENVNDRLVREGYAVYREY